MTKDARLVYSSDPKFNEVCPKCKERKGGCVCVPEPMIQKVSAVLRIEKQGRGGKTVTVVDRLPKVDSYLRSLSSDLKKSCGSGGSYFSDGEFGRVEIQGDKRAEIRELLKKKGIQAKG